MNDLHDIKSETEIESNVLESVHSKKLLSQKSNEQSAKDIDSDSSGALPPPLPVPPKAPNMKLKLAIGGLGLSTLAKGDQDKTAEELADMALLNQGKPGAADDASSNSDGKEAADDNASSSSDAALPPPLPVQSFKPSVLPKLAIGGLGLSTIAKVDGGKTAEELADAAILAGPPKVVDQDMSSSGDEAIVPQETNEDVSGSSSDAALPPPLPIRSQAAGFMPKLAISGLGLSTVAKDGTQTAEQLAD